jgi:hypothetical protein
VDKKYFRRAAKMRTVYIMVEGPTEEEFINSVVAPYLKNYGIVNILPIGLETSPGFTGGDISFKRYRLNAENLLLSDPNSIVTSLIDYYELRSDFPGFDTSYPLAVDRVNHIEHQISSIITDKRFIPYIQLHEFEGLLFSDIKGFQDMPKVHMGRVQYVINHYPNPERINDGPDTTPAARLKTIIPRYRKPFHGPIIAITNGIGSILDKCPRFKNWIDLIIQKAKVP